MKFRLENRESPPTVETVRVALFHKGKFLILRKSSDSKNPGGLEFPGGKIDHITSNNSTLLEQEKAVFDEVQQETGIDIKELPLEKIEDFEIYFESQGKRYKRKVHLFLVSLPDSQDVLIKVNETKNEKGESEDNHANFGWVTSDELINSATNLEENYITKEKTYPLSRNSRHIKKLIEATKKR